MRLTHWRISTRLSFTIAFTLFFFVVVCLLYTVILQKCLSQNQSLRDRELHIQQLASAVAVQTLQARRAEKDFLLYHEMHHVEQVTAAVQEATRQANDMMLLSRAAGQAQVEAQSAQIVQTMNGYLAAFLGLVEGYKTIGLTAESGLQGAFRQASHLLETLLQPETAPNPTHDGPHLEFRPERVITYLQLRRSEKDYLLRHEAGDATNVHTWLRRLQEQMTATQGQEAIRQKASQLLTDYAHAFDAMLTQETNNAVLLTSLRTMARQVEPLSDTIQKVSQTAAAQIAMDTQAFGERASVLLLLFSLLTVAVCAVVCGTIIRSIAGSLRAMQQFSQEVAQGHWGAAIPEGGGDEMTLLAESMRALVNHLRAVRLLSDRLLLVMVLIGRGTLPDKVEEGLHGDFQAASQTLNQMLDTLSCVRLVTQRLVQLNRGILPDQVDETPFEGEFKEMVSALNGLLVQKQRTEGTPPGALPLDPAGGDNPPRSPLIIND
ncbi:MAG: hypothetical protein HQL87_16200 [Magnetococcales bacterium]|nr:hypothetical protein [Magnetococcales bacterium]